MSAIATEQVPFSTVAAEASSETPSSTFSHDAKESSSENDTGAIAIGVILGVVEFSIAFLFLLAAILDHCDRKNNVGLLSLQLVLSHKLMHATTHSVHRSANA
jgi:hypothetical protein